MLEGVPTDAGQRYVLFVDAERHRSHSVFPVSFKEKGAFCSLQLSFAKEAQDGTLSADIDLLTDIGHFGEVIRNKVTRMKTDPFTVYALLFEQGIRPLYTLKV